MDDNATTWAILQHQVGLLGDAQRLRRDGADACALLRDAAEDATRYDAALLDLCMPGMDGIELARAIKADPASARSAW